MLRSLRSRLFVLLLLTMAPLVALNLYQAWETQERRTTEYHRRAARLVDSLADRHALLVRDVGRVLAILAAAPAVAQGTPARCGPVLAAVADADSTFANIVRATPDGTVDCAAHNLFRTIPDAARPAFRRAIATGRPAVGPAHVMPLHGLVPVLPFARPLRDESGGVRAVITAGVRLDWFGRLADHQGVEPDTVVLLTDADGTVLAASPDNQGLRGETLSALPAAVHGPVRRSGFTVGDSPRIVATTATADGLRIVVGIADTTAEIAQRRALLLALGVGAFALFIALAAAHGAARNLVLSHLAPLRRVADRVARGDFGERIGPPYRGPGEMVELMKTFDDMVERVAERELDLLNSETQLLVKRQSEKRYRSLVEQAPEAIIVVLDGRIAFANGKAAEVFGAPALDALVGRHVHEVVRDDDTLRTRIAQPPADSAPAQLHEAQFHRLDDQPFWAEIAMAPVIYGRLSAWHVVVRDITARKQMERQLAQASKLAILGELAAGLAHELSQPMNVIRVAAEAARMEDRAVPLAAATREHLDLIADQAARMGDIIDRVRLFARPSQVETGVFDAIAAARSAVTFMAPQVETDGIALDTYFEGEDGLVDGVAVHVEQIVLNLLANARDSLGRRLAAGDHRRGWDPRITVWARRVPAEQRVIITVGDNGGGIPDGLTERIFDPFYTTKDVGKGAGLGLSICYALASAMGGSLTVHNEDGGAVFTLSLPTVGKAEDGPQAAEGAVREDADGP